MHADAHAAGFAGNVCSEISENLYSDVPYLFGHPVDATDGLCEPVSQ